MKLRSMLLAVVLALTAPFAALAAITQFDFDDTRWHKYYNEFDTYTVGHWTITTTEAGAGDATEALVQGDGGALLITNDAADNDLDFFQLLGESFRFDSTKRLYFAARFKVSDATQSDFVIGLQITDTTMLDVTDGIFFQKDDGDAFLDFNVEKNNTATSTTAIHTMVADTYVKVAFYYDPGDGLKIFLNDELVGSSVITNVVDDEDLTVSFGLQNGEAVAKTMTVDYVFAAKQR